MLIEMSDFIADLNCMTSAYSQEWSHHNNGIVAQS